jgi:hypothetical protein
MKIPPLSASFTPREPRAPSENLGLSFNRKNDIDEKNVRSGGNYSYDKEVRGANAQLILDLMV